MSEQTIESPRDEAGRFTGTESTEHRAVEISDSMAKAERPFDAFTPMPRQPAESDSSYRSDSDGLKSAAQELVKKRQEAEQNAPVQERAYHTEAKADKPRRPITETVKLREAAADLSSVRQAEPDADSVLKNLSLREKLDRFRQDANAEDRGQVEAAQAPQPQPETPQHEAPQQQTGGVHPEVVEALKNPHVRAALEQEAMAHAGARQQYLQSVQTLHDASLATVMANFPELQQGNTQQVLEQMRVQNPARFAEITGHLQKVQQIGHHWLQLRAQQQQQAVQQFEAYGRAEDQKFDDYASTRPASEAKIVRENVASVLESEFGIDANSLRTLYTSNAAFRSAQAQRLVYAAVRNVLAERGIKQAPAHVPHVMRPGEAVTSGTDNSALAAAFKAFNADANPRSAAKALMARRKAAAGLR